MFKKISEMGIEDLCIKILLHGDSGAGKTFCASSLEKPLILLTEKNGMVSIERSSPDAVMAVCTTAQEVRSAFEEIITKGLASFGCKTLVIDSLTEIQRLFKDEILEKSKSKIFSLKNWGELAEVMRKFMRMIRNLDMNVICTSLSQYVPEEDTTRILPSFEGKVTPQEVAQYFTAVGFVYRYQEKDARNSDTKYAHKVMFEGPARVTCKPCGHLTGTVDADMKHIFKLIRGQDVGSTDRE